MVEAAIARYGVPEHLRSDNGPEFIAYCMQDWLKAQAIKTFIQSSRGALGRNGHIESFHDKLREECLNRELFGSRHEARVILESWRVEYSERRPHSSLGYQSPNEYACRRMNSLQPFVRCHVVLPQYSADLCQFLERRDRRTMDTLVQCNIDIRYARCQSQ